MWAEIEAPVDPEVTITMKESEAGTIKDILGALSRNAVEELIERAPGKAHEDLYFALRRILI